MARTADLSFQLIYIYHMLFTNHNAYDVTAIFTICFHFLLNGIYGALGSYVLTRREYIRIHRRTYSVHNTDWIIHIQIVFIAPLHTEFDSATEYYRATMHNNNQTTFCFSFLKWHHEKIVLVFWMEYHYIFSCSLLISRILKVPFFTTSSTRSPAIFYMCFRSNICL